MEVMKGRSSLQYNRKMGSTGEVIELLDKKKKLQDVFCRKRR